MLTLDGLPEGVLAVMSTRQGGGSVGMYASANLGLHVGDDASVVMQNRKILAQQVGSPIAWVDQVHGTDVVYRDERERVPIADAQWTDQADLALAIGVADCLPVGLVRTDASAIAVVHAGWRGLVGGVIENAVDALASPVLAVLGPCIGPTQFQVGPEVRDQFTALDPGARQCFVPDVDDRWLADLRGLAYRRLRGLGVGVVHDINECTVLNPERWFSYRREAPGGRMALVLKINPGS